VNLKLQADYENLPLAPRKATGFPDERSPALPPRAANLKFLSVLLQVRHRNFKFKAALEINELLELL
jgi:hypothetical protein